VPKLNKQIKDELGVLAISRGSASDFETHAPGSNLTEVLRFGQEGHPELKCYSAPIKSSSKTWWSGRQPCY